MTGPGPEIKELVDEIFKVQKEYARIHRYIISPWRYEQALNEGLIKSNELSSSVIRESVLEHIGHLPALATIIYPYLARVGEVDLARTLLYLSIHEAPERITGDKISTHKTSIDDEEELAAARQIFSGKCEKYLALYEDYHFIRNIDAQFAMSVDKLAPFFFYDFFEPKFRRFYWKPNGVTWEALYARQTKLMDWDSTIRGLYDYIMQTIKSQDGE
jgi:5'-deoxynucleotidase YfbR-like HD superfamily hydrolase